MNEWNIQSRAHACQACGKGFRDKESFHTLLSDERRELLRLDVCETCWQAQHGQGAAERKGFISHWQGTYEAPPAAPPEAIKKENAETLLRKLIELNDAQYAASAYILAVMLERKRLLKVKEQLQRNGQRVFLYEQPGTGDLFTITDPNLQLNHIEQVQRDVAHLLEHGLPGEPAVGGPPPVPTPETGAEGTPAETATPLAVAAETAPR